MRHLFGVRFMLALLAVFGALGAGLIADAIIKTPESGEAEGEDEAERAEDADALETEDAGSSPLDFAAGDDEPDEDTAAFSANLQDGMPVSDDIPDAADVPVTLAGGTADDVLSGGNADDRLAGGGGDDQLTGRDGNDSMSGGAGRDHLDGGTGIDWLHGRGGADVLAAGDGQDVLMGGSGNDDLSGHAGHDALSGGNGRDLVQGGEGQDTLTGGSGRDTLSGGTGHDLLSGGGSGDEIDGGDGDDTLWSSADGTPDQARDFLNGGTGNDHLMLGAGDYGTGGEGEDLFALNDIFPNGPVAHITDFDPAEDQLVVLYDAATHSNPDLQIDIDPQTGLATLRLDGVAVAVVENGQSVSLDLVDLRAA